MPYSIRDIATALGAEAEGDLDITVSGAAGFAIENNALVLKSAVAAGEYELKITATDNKGNSSIRRRGGDCAFRDHRRRRAHRGAGADRKPCVDCRRRGDRG